MKKIINSREHSYDKLNHYEVIVENDIAAFGIDTNAEKNQYAVFPKDINGNIVCDQDNMSFGLYSDDISALNLSNLFTTEELLGLTNIEKVIEEPTI